MPGLHTLIKYGEKDSNIARRLETHTVNPPMFLCVVVY